MKTISKFVNTLSDEEKIQFKDLIEECLEREKDITESSIQSKIAVNKLETNFSRKVLLVISYGMDDKLYRQTFERVLSLIGNSTKISFVIYNTEEFEFQDFQDKNYLNFDFIIFIGHGNENTVIKLNFKNNSNEYLSSELFKKIEEKSKCKNFLLLSCNGQYYLKKIKKIYRKNICFAEGSISFEHVELFLSVFFRMINYKCSFKESFEWAKFSMLLKFPENSEFKTI